MSRGRITVVAGPPAAGKSSWVDERMAEGDLVVDYDRLYEALTGLSSHERSRGAGVYAAAARDAVLAELAERGDRSAWVVATAPSRAERDRLRRDLGAEVVVLETPVEVCRRRARADGRPRDLVAAIDSWFEAYEPSPDDEVIVGAEGLDERVGRHLERFSRRAGVALGAREGVS